MRLFRLLAGLALSFALLSGGAFNAHAAPDTKELSKPRAKFQHATELGPAGNYSAALEAFREVGQVKMTPQVRYHIALCEEKLGHLAAALGGYELAAADAKKVDPAFEKEVLARSDDLRARIPKLIIKRGVGAESAQIELDGTALGASSIGGELNLDPGPHEVRAHSAGKQNFTQTVELAEKDTKTVEVTLAGEADPERPIAGAGPAPEADQPHKDESQPGKKPSRVLPIVLGGVGVVSLGVAGFFFLKKQSAVSDLEDQCGPNRDQCPASAKGKYDDAKRYNTISQVA